MPHTTSNAPVLNEYKVDFVVKRWIETLLGGVRPIGLEDDLMGFIVASQLVLLLVPVLAGIVFTVIAEAGGAVVLHAQLAYGCMY